MGGKAIPLDETENHPSGPTRKSSSNTRSGGYWILCQQRTHCAAQYLRKTEGYFKSY
ncbi:hypothetical protein MTBUT4_160037 [Magnetospirillum sp. UT-4]|nr:hypothetical protein MTBUT4_160037 [Magnetospirillum sp. UT-4]